MARLSGSRTRSDDKPDLWRRALRGLRAFEDSWVGELIGLVCLFGTYWLLFVFGWALS